ncbi:HNH endonuclease [Viridibacillus arvi]|uniref:HNH endonuclease n=1 Tax=Viridibacillus arvi TaxID=263475 RepID=UPI003D0904BD
MDYLVLYVDLIFMKCYGEQGKDYIEVHHVKPLSTLEKEVVIDPEKDLVTVCVNCHRMIHRRKDDILTIEELRILVIHRK